MVFEQLFYQEVFLHLTSHNAENGWTTDKSRFTQMSLTAKLFLSKKTANNIFESHKKQKNSQNIAVFVKISC